MINQIVLLLGQVVNNSKSAVLHQHGEIAMEEDKIPSKSTSANIISAHGEKGANGGDDEFFIHSDSQMSEEHDVSWSDGLISSQKQ